MPRRTKALSAYPNPVQVGTRILDVAEALAQTRGFNGFSYADIAAKLLVTKASIHYHFPSKADLGLALVERYRIAFSHALDEIDRTVHDAREKLQRYAQLYDAVLRHKRMCLCGMLAAEYSTLPAPMQAELRAFFDANERWLGAVLDDGRRQGILAFTEPSEERARALLGALEGAMLVARAYGEPARFSAVAQSILSDLSSDSRPSPHSRTSVDARTRLDSHTSPTSKARKKRTATLSP